MRLVLALAFLAATSPLAAQSALDFEPRVGTVGARVKVKASIPPGAELRFGSRIVTPLRELDGSHTFIVPAGGVSSFVEVVVGERVLARSSVPFVVAGSSLVNTPKLVGLKEAIDVFGYVDPSPETNIMQKNPRQTFSLDSAGIFTLGEAPPERFGPAVELSDAASGATRGMGPAGLIITARPPRKKTVEIK